MTTNTIKGTIVVRHDTLENWSREDIPGKGKFRVLANGEIGWVDGTSDFKIGNGVSPWFLLPWVKPDVNNAIYSVKLGDSTGFYTYDDLYDKLLNHSTRITTLEAQFNDESKGKTQYANGKEMFPEIGIVGTLYIDSSTGDSYYYDDGSVSGIPGYHQVSGFDRIECQI